MLSDDLLAAGMGAAGDQIDHMLRDHEEGHHAGKPCLMARVQTVAWLAHRLGLSTDEPSSIILLQMELRMIEARCPDCPHGETE